MLMMGDSSYSNHSGRSEYRTEWTPYSAVSSFNYPATCDSSLTTPNTTIHPQSMPLRMAPIKQEAPSPSTGPSYQYYPDDGFTDMRCRSPMKFRDPSTTKPAVTSNNETDYPPSPFFSHEPYYGNFSVSAGSSSSFPTSGMTASPVMGTHGHHQSLAQLPLPQPSQLSAGGYRSQYQAPILIAPDPRSRKPSTTSTQIGSRRQGSLDSSLSTPRSTHAVQGPGGSPYLKSQETTSNANRQRKRKTPTQGPLGNESDGESSGGDPTEHLLLVQLRDNEGLPWKVVQDEFNKRTGQDKKIPCLEMRLKRHRERTRRWTEVDERALKNAHNSYKKNKRANKCNARQ